MYVVRDLLDRIVEASKENLRRVAGLQAQSGNIYHKSSPCQGDRVLVFIGVTGSISGQVIFSMPTETAIGIVSGMMMGESNRELDSISNSVILEAINMILGWVFAQPRWNETGIVMSSPCLLMGDKMQIFSNRKRCFCVPLKLSNNTEMEIDVLIEE